MKCSKLVEVRSPPINSKQFYYILYWQTSRWIPFLERWAQMVVLKTKPEEVMASEMVISEQKEEKWTFRTSIGEQTWSTCYIKKNSERKFWKWVFMSQRLRLLRWQLDSWIVKEERKVDCRKLLSWYVGVIIQYQFSFGTLLQIFYLDLYLNFIYLWFIQFTIIVPLEYKGVYLLPTTKFTELMNS